MADLAGAPIFALKTPKVLFEEEKQEQEGKQPWGSFLQQLEIMQNKFIN